jgi:hypothetical protein
MFDDVDDTLFLRQAEAAFFGEDYDDYWMIPENPDYDTEDTEDSLNNRG